MIVWLRNRIDRDSGKIYYCSTKATYLFQIFLTTFLNAHLLVFAQSSSVKCLPTRWVQIKKYKLENGQNLSNLGIQ